jgi:virulence factor Mce-like protein
VRKAAAVTVLVVLAAAGVVALRGAGGSSKGAYRVDVVLDNARGLVPGQLVQVAGGRVGTIKAVDLTPGFKARVEMSVDRRFAPFKTDATCSIRSQGLIAENYVQCDPGTAKAAALKGSGGEPPTVPVERTTQPVGLNDLFQIWATPTRERLGVLLSELGLATAGRGDDLNSIIRRANPALGEARHTLSILQRQHGDLKRAIDASDVVVRQLARVAPTTPALLRHSANVLARTRSRSRELAGTVQRLPALLTQARPALDALDSVASSGTPLLAQLERSAPELTSLSTDAAQLARTARPAVAALGPVLTNGAGTLQRAAPLSGILAQYAKESLPSAQLSGKLWTNLQQQAFTENLLRFFYNSAAATARYDSTSHILPAHITLNACVPYAATPVPGCSANYSGGSGEATPPQSLDSVLGYLLK